MKNYLNRLFIDGLSGMALGLFSTLIIGTILQQLAGLIAGPVGSYMYTIGGIAKILTGAGIGCGVAVKFREPPLVALSAATAGMVGAFAGQILSGSLLTNGVVHFGGPGEPLGAFIAAYVGIELGHLVAGKTRVDILIIPAVAITAGSVVGLLLGPPISGFMTWLGSIINWATVQQPILMGIVIAVLMGMFLTLPISSAAIGVSLNLSGIAAGAAVVGCCANMVGFAVSSYRENKVGGLIAQGVGTSMLQMPNIVRKPIIWLPAILTSAILGPVSTALLGMTNNAVGSGMGTAGLVGQIMGFQTLTGGGMPAWLAVLEILMMHIVLPAFFSLIFSEGMRRFGIIKQGDMKLDIS